jgi:hypothetical protein
MKTKTLTFELCRHRNRPDAACKTPRCCRCGRPLRPFDKGWTCTSCRTNARESDAPDVREQSGGVQ